MLQLVFIASAQTTAEERLDLYLSWISHCYSIPKEILTSVKSSTGKPGFHSSGSDEPIYFSSSHSADSLFFGVSKTEDFAVDVESISERKKMDAVLKRFFSSEEVLHVEASPDPLKTFLWLWTRREALIKNTGEGLAAIGKPVVVLEDEVHFQKIPYFLNSEIGLSPELSKRFVASYSVRKNAPSPPDFSVVVYPSLEEAKMAFQRPSLISPK